MSNSIWINQNKYLVVAVYKKSLLGNSVHAKNEKGYKK